MGALWTSEQTHSINPLPCSWEEAVPGVGGWADWNPDTSWGGRRQVRGWD